LLCYFQFNSGAPCSNSSGFYYNSSIFVLTGDLSQPGLQAMLARDLISLRDPYPIIEQKYSLTRYIIINLLPVKGLNLNLGGG